MFTNKSLLQIVILLLFLGLAGQASAHAVVTESSLEIAPVTADQATEIKLNFNSHIELGLSQIFLVSAGDRQTLLEAVTGSRPGQIIVSLPPLPPGEYALRFKVFAADGHLTEDIIHFIVTK